jgi:two-component system sensor histidine kinase KdpD
MLEAARAQRETGLDVVIGVVETHKRPETEELLTGLDTVPLRLVEYHGTVLKEFDLDAALARRPTLILVDELAHTNTPGSRHAKRWQDVLELRDAGIDVYTTVNVQHLESLNDLERPRRQDHGGDRARDDSRLRVRPGRRGHADRFAHRGPASPPGRGQGLHARGGRRGDAEFLPRGNLIALRELALPCAADHVDAQMQRYRRDRAVAPTWPVAGRIMVCISPHPLSIRLVRAGRRLAARLGAQWVVVYVETPVHAQLSAEDRARVAATLRFAERLGAETTTLTGPRVSDEILAYARSRNVSQIVIGKPARPLWRRILFGSDVDALVRGSGDIDISVISGEWERDTTEPRRIRSRPAGGAAYGLALRRAGRHGRGVRDVLPRRAFELVMSYVLGVVVVAARLGRGPAGLAVLLSIAAFDFFFVPPYFSFAVDSQYLVTVTVMRSSRSSSATSRRASRGKRRRRANGSGGRPRSMRSTGSWRTRATSANGSPRIPAAPSPPRRGRCRSTWTAIASARSPRGRRATRGGGRSRVRRRAICDEHQSRAAPCRSLGRAVLKRKRIASLLER